MGRKIRFIVYYDYIGIPEIKYVVPLLRKPCGFDFLVLQPLALNYYNSMNVPSIASECSLFLFQSPQHVSAPTGHPQMEHTLIIAPREK
jgi:hypothetical protein